MLERKKEIKQDGRIRLTILGGYLGSGKTTWLRHQLYQNSFGRAHILVNEAAETPVDDALLEHHAAGISLLAGGCACCVGQGELIHSLKKLSNERSQISSDAERLEQVILETSGLADPAAIAAVIRSDPMLVHHVLLDEIVVLADTVNLIDQLGTEQLGRAQIEAADRVILTKADMESQPAFDRVHATISKLNPAANISAAVKGQPFETGSDADAEPYQLPVLGNAPEQEPIVPTRLKIDESVDWAAFSVWLSALLHARGHDIVRVKGVFETPAGYLLLQGIRNAVQSPEILPSSSKARPNEIVFIGRNFALADLQRSLTYFA